MSIRWWMLIWLVGLFLVVVLAAGLFSYAARSEDWRGYVAGIVVVLVGLVAGEQFDRRVGHRVERQVREDFEHADRQFYNRRR